MQVQFFLPPSWTLPASSPTQPPLFGEKAHHVLVSMFRVAGKMVMIQLFIMAMKLALFDLAQ